MAYLYKNGKQEARLICWYLIMHESIKIVIEQYRDPFLLPLISVSLVLIAGAIMGLIWTKPKR